MKIPLRMIPFNERLERQLEKEVKNVIYMTFLIPIAKAWKGKKQNSNLTELQKAIKNGKVQYQEGMFSGIFTENISREITKLGGVYNNKNRIYILAKEKLPDSLIKIIEIVTMENLNASKRMLEMINGIETSTIIDLSMTFEPTFFNIINDTINKTKKSFDIIPKEHRKIGIYYSLSNEQKKNIAKQYSDNMKLYIKDFTQEQTQILRKEVEANIERGGIPRNLEKFIVERFDIANNKAKFLARQETSLCTVAQKTELYKEQGVQKLRWKATQDSKTRPLHKKLHNQIFDFNNLPIIDEHTGEHGLPGQSYNCRCNFIPYMDI